MRAATVAGVRHRLAGKAGEDAFAWAVLPAGPGDHPAAAWVIAAVADGVSATAGAAAASALAVSSAVKAGVAAARDSGPAGERPAEPATEMRVTRGPVTRGSGERWPGKKWPATKQHRPEWQATGNSPTEQPTEQPAKQEAVALARLALEAAAKELRERPDGARAGARAGIPGGQPGHSAGGSGATTLLVAAVSAAGEWGVARVGDSSPFLLSEGHWHDLFPGDSEDGEPVQTATAALSADQPAPSIETAGGYLEPAEALLLLTDGLAAPLRDGPETVAPALAGALSTPPSPLTLAAAADFSRQGCHDDRTILAVWWVPTGGD